MMKKINCNKEECTRECENFNKCDFEYKLMKNMLPVYNKNIKESLGSNKLSNKELPMSQIYLG